MGKRHRAQSRITRGRTAYSDQLRVLGYGMERAGEDTPSRKSLKLNTLSVADLLILDPKRIVRTQGVMSTASPVTVAGATLVRQIGC